MKISFLLVVLGVSAYAAPGKPVKHGDSGRMAVQMYRSDTFQAKETATFEASVAVPSSTDTVKNAPLDIGK